ncbi:tRNA pseudouridine(55) synthase TruB [Sulfuriferula sp. AH1]|uniref:tRNA pseudouridine(55) synthase TruB n=1 Tax=Sulfuriferula sp. AH1 TaxID=1985873 RepID=UPI003510AD29
MLNKPVGITSNTALQIAKRLYQAEKAGHTGTLDPFADGLLPLCFGEATKFSQYQLEADKRYRAVLQLGVTTTTGDPEGEVLETCAVDVMADQVTHVVAGFVGNIMQTPPMYSALKHQGKPLYEYARAGITIERPARPVLIRSIDILEFGGNTLVIDVTCSAGTYIRTLAEDIGHMLGCGAHLTRLTRLASGGSIWPMPLRWPSWSRTLLHSVMRDYFRRTAWSVICRDWKSTQRLQNPCCRGSVHTAGKISLKQD